MRSPRQTSTDAPRHTDPYGHTPSSDATNLTPQLLARGLAHNALNALHYVSGSVMLASQQLETLVHMISTDQQAGQLAEAQHICAAAYEGISKAQDGIRGLQNLVAAQFSRDMQPRLVSDILQRATLTIGVRSFIKVHTPSDALVMAAASQIEDVIINIIKNAQEAGGDNCPINIRSEMDPDNKGVTIVIADQGPGIDAEIATHVFEPSFSTKARGSGIGLAVSRYIIDIHGGQLTLDPSVGQGARFLLWLPLVQSHP